MPQSQVQIEQQVERQLQKLTPQQLMVAKLVELPMVELEDRIKTELYDNVALEEGHGDSGADDTDTYGADSHDDSGADTADDGMSADSSPTEDGGGEYGEDDIPVYAPSSGRAAEEEIPIGDTKSFIEDLKRQIYDYNLSDKQQELVEYLIGTLDDRGFIDRSLQGISDDLLFNFDIDASTAELEEALGVLQGFDPPGIGARDLRECLILQIDRKLSEATDTDIRNLLQLERDIVDKHLAKVQRNMEGEIAGELGQPLEAVRQAIEGIARLNPHPGLALSESSEDRAQTVIPDFIIETSPDGEISVELNCGEIPELRVSPGYEAQLKDYQRTAGKMSKSTRQAFEYMRQKVEGAKMFIDSIRQRQHTLYITMKAIVSFQRDFILTQDESQLLPMRLVDVAERTHLDISTVSRVRKSKYALVDGQIYPLDFFFLRARTNAGGEALEHKEIKERMRELIDAEDKRKPLSDQKIVELLMKSNFNISRRTVAKYRSEMGILPTIERKTL